MKFLKIFKINSAGLGFALGPTEKGQKWASSKSIAICSPNCVQIWKGRDQKMVFCRVRLVLTKSRTLKISRDFETFL